MIDRPLSPRIRAARRLRAAAVVAALAPALSPAALAQGAGAKLPAPGSVFRDCPQCPEMVVIPSGAFVMGSPDAETGRREHEGPQRRVTIAQPLALGKYEVTRGEFAAFVRETRHATAGECFAWNEARKVFESDSKTATWRAPGFDQTDRHPVVCVTWDDAKAYVAWLSRKTGKRYRLPSEAEWEYAARAGATTRFSWGDDQDALCRHANFADASSEKAWNRFSLKYCDDGHGFTAPVGSFAANGFGLHDMSGNVIEWVEDRWTPDYNGAPPDGRPQLENRSTSFRVVRGGSWRNLPSDLRPAHRGMIVPWARRSDLGFRVVRTD